MEFLKDGFQFLAEYWALTACLTIISLVYWHYVKTYTKIKRLGLKGPTPWPLIGTSGWLLQGKDLHLVWDEYCKKYGKVYGMYLFQMPTLIISDTEVLKSILVKDFEFHDRPVSSILFDILQIYPPFKDIRDCLQKFHSNSFKKLVSLDQF